MVRAPCFKVNFFNDRFNQSSSLTRIRISFLYFVALWDRSKKGCFVNEYILSVFDVVGPVFRIKIYHHFLSLYLFTKPLIHCTHILLATPCTLQAHTNTIILTVRTKTLIYWTGTSSLHFYFFYSYPTMQQCSRNDNQCTYLID